MTAALRVGEERKSVGRDWSGLWRQSVLVAKVYGPRPQFVRVRPQLLRLVMLPQLAIADRRANEAGSAVCCLSGASNWPKAKGAAAATGMLLMSAGLFVAALYATWPVVILVVATALPFVPLSVQSLAARPARRALRNSRPRRGEVVVVHTVASGEPGAGRKLLDAVAEEADRKGWTLVLDAGNHRLASYYRGLGFEPTGPPVLMPWGEDNIPMARRPANPQSARDG